MARGELRPPTRLAPEPEGKKSRRRLVEAGRLACSGLEQLPLRVERPPVGTGRPRQIGAAVRQAP